MKLVQPDIRCDFCETSLDWARQALGAPEMHMLKVYVTWSSTRTARRLQAEHGFELVVIPDELSLGRYCWAAEYAGRLFGSPGAM